MILGKYNQSKRITFDLVAPDGIDLITNATFAAGDLKIMKNEGAEVDTANLPVDEGTGYSLFLTATEMSAARIRVYLVDQTATKVWLDVSLGIETYGNVGAEHAFDLDTASTPQTGDTYPLATGSVGFAAIDTTVNAIILDTDELQGDNVPGLIAALDAVVDTVKAETALILADTTELITFTVGSASLTTTTFSTDLTLVADQYGSSSGNSMYIRFDLDTWTTALRGQTAKITGCAVTNGVITISSALTIAPSSTDSGQIF